MFGLGTIDRMNAAEIRKRAEAARNKLPDVKHLLDRVFKAIELAAEKGEMELTTNPLAGLRMRVTEQEAAAVWNTLRERGYRVSNGKRFRISWEKP